MITRNRFGLLRLLVCAAAFPLSSIPSQASQVPPPAENVILLTLDGVRWQEVFKGDQHGQIFRNLWQELATEGVIFGDRGTGSWMTVSNDVNISLPAYQSIMAGAPQGCLTNTCGRISVETLQERIRRELGVTGKQVTTIASWEQIPNAVEHVEGITFVNAAFQNLDDGTGDEVFSAINEAQSKDKPLWGGARYDKYTWAHSMHYLTKHRPRFLFISLNDSDEWGHRGEWERYVETLRHYDERIRELIVTLRQMGKYGERTTLIVTTDHGRGDGENWTHHGRNWPASKYIWLYGRPAGGEISPYSVLGDGGYRHVDIRPTIEASLGLKTIPCKDCGRVIWELLPQ